MLTGYLARPARLAGVVLSGVALLGLCVACARATLEPTVTPVPSVAPTVTPVPTTTWEQPGCLDLLNNPGYDLPFTSLAQQGGNATFEEKRVYLIRSSKDIAPLQSWVHRTVFSALRDNDYSQRVALAVFDGLKPDSCYGIAIERVTRVGQSLVVCAHHWGISPGEGMPECEPSFGTPYHVVFLGAHEIPNDADVILCTRLVPRPTPEPR